MATSNNDRISSQRLLDTLKGLQASRHLGSEPEVDPQTNEKTKHTIKQDYLPNADWNVNDPDADGYVQGRTHWVERTVGDIPVTTVQGMPTIPEMVKPEGFKTGTTTWKPDYEAIAFEGAESGMTYTGYLLAEDENGNQITDASSIFDGETFYTGVAIVYYSALAPNLYPVICRYNNEDVQADYILGVTEVIHKLPKMYYEQTDEEALKNEVYTNIMSKLHYKQLTFDKTLSDFYEIDDTSEIEAFFTSNNYSSKTVDNAKVWYKDTSHGTVKFYIITELWDGHILLFCDNDSEPVTFEYLSTSITNYRNTTATQELWRYLNSKIMLLGYDKTNEKIFGVRLKFNKNNEVVVNYNNEDVVIGSINKQRMNINTDLFTVMFVKNPHVQDFCHFTFVDDDLIQNITNRDFIEYYDSYISGGVKRVKLSEYYVYNKVVNREISVTTNYNEITINANEELTYTVDKWIPQSSDTLIVNTSLLDDIVGKELFIDYEDRINSQTTETRTIKYWVDSDYTLHIRNKYDGLYSHLPIQFTIIFNWTTSSGEAKLWKAGSYYCSEL